MLALIEHLKKYPDFTEWDEFVEKIKITHGENNPSYLALVLAQREMKARNASDFAVLDVVADVAGMADELYELVLIVANAVGQLNPEQIQSLKDATDRHDEFIMNLKVKIQADEQSEKERRERQAKNDLKQLEQYIK